METLFHFYQGSPQIFSIGHIKCLNSQNPYTYIGHGLLKHNPTVLYFTTEEHLSNQNTRDISCNVCNFGTYFFFF